jgi:hypothetical protein
VNRILSLATVAALAIVMIGCSDDSTSPTPTTPYVPTKVGSYFISNIELIDTTGVSTSFASDSSVYVGTKTVDGKNASILQANTVSLFGPSVDSNYFNEASGAVNAYTDVSLDLGSAGLSPIEFGEKWMKVFASSGTWTAWDTTIAGYTGLEYNGAPLVADIEVSYDFKVIGTENVTVNGTVLSCTKIEGTQSWRANVTSPIPVDIQVPLVTTYWWAPGAMLVKAEQLPTQISVPGIFTSKVPGFRQTLLRYKID